MPKDIAIETAENQLRNAGSQLWRHLVNTHMALRGILHSKFAVGISPPPDSWLSWARSLPLDCDEIGIGGSERNSRKASAAQLSVEGGACILIVTTADCAESHEYTFESRRLYILCWRGHSRRKLSPTLATPTTLVLTTLVAQCELSKR